VPIGLQAGITARLGDRLMRRFRYSAYGRDNALTIIGVVADWVRRMDAVAEPVPHRLGPRATPPIRPSREITVAL
jgi:hypothetical protein